MGGNIPTIIKPPNSLHTETMVFTVLRSFHLFLFSETPNYLIILKRINLCVNKPLCSLKIIFPDLGNELDAYCASLLLKVIELLAYL